MATRGRPPWKPTAAQRRKVSAGAAGGMSKELIAAGLGVDCKTLVKHCEAELTAGAAARRLEALDALHRQARRGNVAACKAVLAFEASRLPETPPAPGDVPAAETPAPAAAKAPRLGKKEIANLQAGSAAQGSAWEGVLPAHGQPPTVQ